MYYIDFTSCVSESAIQTTIKNKHKDKITAGRLLSYIPKSDFLMTSRIMAYTGMY